ncbi:MAG TPA: hypothetical protein VF791_11410 [Pyrinomonadaceae bacterium]
MGFFQKLFGGLFSKDRAADMEAESRAWMMQCPCGHEISVWEAGGIRYKAKGEKKTLMRCQKCGERTWHRVYKKSDQEQQAGGAV